MLAELAGSKEILVVSGKGGTGKTTLTVSFAVLSSPCVLADCDVDAADLFLVAKPEKIKSETFRSGREPVFDLGACTRCGRCAEDCRFSALTVKNKTFIFDKFACEGCALCSRICPAGAVAMRDKECGEWYISKTPTGAMSHARLHIAEENSGKLVTVVRQHAKNLAQEEEVGTVFIDGPPGIGCPVISSITGVDFAIIVAEPTLSGLHDLKRIAELTQQFKIRTAVCINKYDINEDMTKRIEVYCRSRNIQLLGRVPYDRSVIESLVRGEAVVNLANSNAAKALRNIWEEALKVI